MKKIIIISLTLAVSTFISCGKGNKNNTNQEEPDTGTITEQEDGTITEQGDGTIEPSAPSGSSTPETMYTITNRLDYDDLIFTLGTSEEELNTVIVTLDSVSLTLNKGECINLNKSQFNNVKITWTNDKSLIICSNSTEYKCPTPDNYYIDSSFMAIAFQWNAPQLEKEEKNTGNCKDLN